MGKAVGKGERRPGRWARRMMRLPLRRALFVYVLLFTLAALGLILGTCLLCESAKDDLIAEGWVRVTGEDGRVVLRTYKGFVDATALSTDGEELHYELVMSADMDARYVAGLNEMRRLEDVQPRWERMALGALAERLRETGALLATQTDRAFVLAADEPQTIVQADGQLVERVFDNAMQNALRYASSRVEAKLTAAGGRLVLTVRDDGRGFSPQALAHAADPFWSEDKTGADGHLGLGLNIAGASARGAAAG